MFLLDIKTENFIKQDLLDNILRTFLYETFKLHDQDINLFKMVVSPTT